MKTRYKLAIILTIICLTISPPSLAKQQGSVAARKASPRALPVVPLFPREHAAMLPRRVKGAGASRELSIEPNYLPYVQVGGTQFFNVDINHWATGVDFFIPLWQTPIQHLVFTQLRFYDRSGKPFEGNIHLGYRYLTAEQERLYGIYGAFDRKRSNLGNYYSQLTLGVESWHKQLFFGANFYRPLGKSSRATGWQEEANLNKLQQQPVYSIYNILVTADPRAEQAAPGGDLELGYELVPGLTGYMGGYYFKAKDLPALYGPKARLVYDYSSNNDARMLNIFDKAGLEVGIQHDKRRGTIGYLNVNLRVGLLSQRSTPLTGVARHMVDLVRRDVDIVTIEGGVAKKPPKEATDQAGKPLRIIRLAAGQMPDDGETTTPAPVLDATTHNIIAIAAKPADQAPTERQLGNLSLEVIYTDILKVISPYTGQLLTVDLKPAISDFPDARSNAGQPELSESQDGYLNLLFSFLKPILESDRVINSALLVGVLGGGDLVFRLLRVNPLPQPFRNPADGQPPPGNPPGGEQPPQPPGNLPGEGGPQPWLPPRPQPEPELELQVRRQVPEQPAAPAAAEQQPVAPAAADVMAVAEQPPAQQPEQEQQQVQQPALPQEPAQPAVAPAAEEGDGLRLDQFFAEEEIREEQQPVAPPAAEVVERAAAAHVAVDVRAAAGQPAPEQQPVQQPEQSAAPEVAEQQPVIPAAKRNTKYSTKLTSRTRVKRNLRSNARPPRSWSELYSAFSRLQSKLHGVSRRPWSGWSRPHRDLFSSSMSNKTPLPLVFPSPLVLPSPNAALEENIREQEGVTTRPIALAQDLEAGATSTRSDLALVVSSSSASPNGTEANLDSPNQAGRETGEAYDDSDDRVSMDTLTPEERRHLIREGKRPLSRTSFLEKDQPQLPAAPSSIIQPIIYNDNEHMYRSFLSEFSDLSESSHESIHPSLGSSTTSSSLMSVPLDASVKTTDHRPNGGLWTDLMGSNMCSSVSSASSNTHIRRTKSESDINTLEIEHDLIGREAAGDGQQIQGLPQPPEHPSGLEPPPAQQPVLPPRPEQIPAELGAAAGDLGLGQLFAEQAAAEEERQPSPLLLPTLPQASEQPLVTIPGAEQALAEQPPPQHLPQVGIRIWETIRQIPSNQNAASASNTRIGASTPNAPQPVLPAHIPHPNPAIATAAENRQLVEERVDTIGFINIHQRIWTTPRNANAATTLDTTAPSSVDPNAVLMPTVVRGENQEAPREVRSKYHREYPPQADGTPINARTERHRGSPSTLAELREQER